MPPNTNPPSQPGYSQQPMPPAFPAPPQQHTDGSPYDFFLEAKPKKKTGLPTPGFSVPTLIVVAIGLFLALIVLAVVMSASSSKKDTSLGLGTIVTAQQEIIRVSDLGDNKLESDSLRNAAVTASASTQTAQQEMLTCISRHGGKFNTKTLATATNAQNDRQLDAAEAASTYDQTFHDLMKQLLNDYQIKLERVNSTATSESERAMIDKDIASAQLLDKMLDE